MHRIVIVVPTSVVHSDNSDFAQGRARRMIKSEGKSGRRKEYYFPIESSLVTNSKSLFVGQLLLVVHLLLALNACNGFSTGLHHSCFPLHVMTQSKDSSSMGDKLASTRSNDNDSNEQTEGAVNTKRCRSENKSQAESAVEFARLIGRLKVTPRTGWVRRGVPKWESVADHSWRVAALSLLLPNDYDLKKCIAMGVLHDVAESLTGDICPDDNVSKEDKAKMEAEATEKIALLLGQASGQTDDDSNQNSTQQQLMSLLHEYETRESKEAIGVKDLDLLDMIIQATEYEERFGLDLTDFYDSTPASLFRTPVLKSVAQEVHDQRKARIEALQETKKDKSDECISESDAAFVAKFSEASDISSEVVKQVVKAMRVWEKKNNE
jgi:putative hydrolase of HD superfamily